MTIGTTRSDNYIQRKLNDHVIVLVQRMMNTLDFE